MKTKAQVVATLFGQDLCALVLTCIHFDPDQISAQVDASLLPFGHKVQVFFFITPE